MAAKKKKAKAAKRKPVKRGRPSKYTPEVCAKIYQVIRGGGSQADAAHHVGIHPDTVGDWKKIFPDFADGIARAGSEGKLALLLTVKTASRKDWRAAAWLLAVKWPREFSERHQVDLGDETLSALEKMRLAYSHRKKKSANRG